VPNCNRCGRAYDRWTAACVACGAGLPAITGVTERDVVSPAPAGRRLVAGAVDVSIAVSGLVLGWTALLRVPFLGRRTLILIPLLALPNAYLLLRDAVGGRSIGKALMSLVVYDSVRRTSGGLVDSINRNWPFIVPGLGPTLIAACAAMQLIAGRFRRIGERGSGTLVVTERGALSDHAMAADAAGRART